MQRFHLFAMILEYAYMASLLQLVERLPKTMEGNTTTTNKIQLKYKFSVSQ